MADKETSNPTGENEDPKDEKETEEEDAEDDDDDDSSDDSEEKDGDKKKDPELLRAIKARDRAKAELRKLRAEREKDEKKDDGPTPEEKANARLVRTAAHGVLRGMGVEDKADRAEILDMLNLSDVTVDDDGADEDEIEEKIELLRRAFGGKSGSPGRTVPKSTKRTASTKETTSDPDKARYARIGGWR